MPNSREKMKIERRKKRDLKVIKQKTTEEKVLSGEIKESDVPMSDPYWKRNK